MVTGQRFLMQLTNKNHDINELSILVLKDGFSFCTQEQTFAFPFEHNLPKESDIQTFVSSQNIPTENVQVYFFDAKSILVPTPLYDAAIKEDYLKAAMPVSSKEDTGTDDVSELSLTVVYPQKKAMVSLLQSSFSKVKTKHFSSALLPYLKEVSSGSPKRHIFIHLRKGYFDLFLFQGSQLLLQNTFEQKNADDFLYYLFYVTEQFYLKPEQFKLYFLGEFTPYKKYYKGATDFHPEVEYLTTAQEDKEVKSPIPFFQNFFG